MSLSIRASFLALLFQVLLAMSVSLYKHFFSSDFFQGLPTAILTQLNRRALDGAIGTKHTAVPVQRARNLSTVGALVKN